MKQLHDLCEMYKDKITDSVRWVATPLTNLPYALIKFKKRVYESSKAYAHGTFFVIVKNGENPMEKLMKTNKYKQDVVEKSKSDT